MEKHIAAIILEDDKDHLLY